MATPPTAQASSSSPQEERETAIGLVAFAHAAELSGEFKETFNLHTRAGNIFARLVANGTRKSDVRRKDKLYLRAAKERREVLKAAAEGIGDPPDRPLPSATTWQKESNDPKGKIMLSLVEAGTWGSLVGQVDSFDGLVFDEQSIPYFTPMLPDPSVIPDVQFEVYAERLSSTRRCYLHIKDATKTQTLYSLYTTRGHEQISWASLSRTAEYHQTCAIIRYVQVKETDTKTPITNASIGRTMTVETSLGKRITIHPDRSGKTWSPRRFTYGGRTFVWKDESSLSKLEWELLYEQKGQPTAVEGSKTGKVIDNTFERPVAWMKGKSGMNKVCSIGMAGGLDQLFQELILASAVGKVMVVQFGHG